MVAFIAQRIKLARDISLEEGQAKYRAFFINTALYRAYQSEVDAILEIDGYGDCIVTA